MSKTNFTKVEEALAEGLQKIAMEKLGKEADALKKTQTSEKSGPREDHQERTRIAALLAKDLNLLYKKDKSFFEKFGLKQEDLRKLLENPSKLSEKDWLNIVKLQQSVQKYRINQSKKAESSNDQLVEKERVKSKTKRFNVNSDWLPLQ